MSPFGQQPLFFPAQTVAEAIERIYALTGRSPNRSRGEKRALVALRDSLGLDVDLVRTNAVLGRALAEKFDVHWEAAVHTDRTKVTLAGLNVLLEGAAAASRGGALRRLREHGYEQLSGSSWAGFEPARSKIEAVTRIAALTNAPRETLGPGGKERKSVLLNLGERLLPDARLDRSSKTRLAASIAGELRAPWTSTCVSTGETISLTGLNTLLAGAERHLGRLGTRVSDILNTPESEGHALAAALKAKLPELWHGRKAVQWLDSQGLRGANDNEWQGFYGEEQAKRVLDTAFTPRFQPPRVRYRNTTFDYALNRVWDIKVHTEVATTPGLTRPGRDDTILNDELATRECIDEQGLGFLVISGEAGMDDTGEFVTWHRQFKAARSGSRTAPSNSGSSRTRKAWFSVMCVEAFWIPNTPALDAAILAGAMSIQRQGRQSPRVAGSSGSVRPDKFKMRMTRARSHIRVAELPTDDWHERPQPRSR